MRGLKVKLGRIWCLSATLVDGIDGVCGMPKAVIYYCIALALVFLNVKPQCLKTTEKVALKTLRAKRATFTFRQKLIKNAKNGQIWRVFEV